MSQEEPTSTPEGRLIGAAARATGRSARQLAANAGMSDTRWRQVIKGSQPGPGGSVLRVTAPATTIARMAYVVGITPEDLSVTGRDDAVPLLHRLYTQPPALQPIEATTGLRESIPDEIEMIYASRTMTPAQKLDAIRKVLHLRAQIDAEVVDVPDRADAPSS